MYLKGILKDICKCKCHLLMVDQSVGININSYLPLYYFITLITLANILCDIDYFSIFKNL